MMKNRPNFSDAEAIQLAKSLYGITAVSSPLPSERDQNFLLTTSNKEQFVLKITSLIEALFKIGEQFVNRESEIRLP